MKTVTIDASAAISWLFPNQATQAATAFLTAGSATRLVAPAIFAWEVGNQIGVRSKHDDRELDALVDDLLRLGIEIAPPVGDAPVIVMIDQAVRLSLSLFDTAYLNHALVNGTALASRDKKLLQAAHNAGLEVFDLRDDVG